jgi:hypothetical protein
MSKKNKEPAIIKRGSTEDWEKSNYIPAENVIIIKDKPDGTVELCIGDGETNVNYLPDILLEKRKDSPIVDVESATLFF